MLREHAMHSSACIVVQAHERTSFVSTADHTPSPPLDAAGQPPTKTWEATPALEIGRPSSARAVQRAS